MPFTPGDVLYGVVVPAAVAGIVTALWRRCVTAESGRRLGAGLPFVGGFHAGYWLLALGPARPEAHWQWLPWLLLLTLFVGIPRLANRFAAGGRLGLSVLIAALSSWLLVPDWAHLDPSRAIHVAALTVATVVIVEALQPLTRRVPPLWLTANLTAVLAGGGVILALSGSLRFAQIAGCGVAALMGMMIVALFDKDRFHTGGLVFPFALLVTGLMLIGRVNSFSEVPLASYLLLPFAPLSLWLATHNRIPATGVRRWFVLSLPVVLSGAAVGLAVASEFGNESNW